MKKGLLLLWAVLTIITAFSQRESYDLWRNSNNSTPVATMRIKTKQFLLKSLNVQAFKALMPTVHNDPSIKTNNNTVVIGIPTPNNTMATFSIQMSQVMAPELEAKYPEIRTFKGQGISDPRATIILDYNLNGIHAMVLSSEGDYFIDPAFTNNTTDYLVYYKKNLIRKYGLNENGGPININEPPTGQALGRAPIIQANLPANVVAINCPGTKLRHYRAAIACTHQYAVAATGKATPTKAQTLSCIQTTLARVNGVYEKELAITMTLVAKEDTVIYTTAATDKFTGNSNSNANTLITQSQTIIDKYVGTANYDIGHTFSTGGGGLSDLGVVCTSGAKASSITGGPQPTGDGYDIDYVAHEMGHAYGANHTFNDNTIGSCQGNFNGPQSGVTTYTNNEPGSGVTIMAYAGICNDSSLNPIVNDDLDPHSIPIFTAMSFNEIMAYTTSGGGQLCPTVTNTTNHPPVVALTANYTIPFKTPFQLNGSASDPDGDSLTYCWEQINVGGKACLWHAPKFINEGDAPIFRSFNPVKDTFRIFPNIRAVVQNLDTVGELKPSYARTLQFRLTARDNRSDAGGVCYNESNVVVTAVTDSFWVKYPTVSTVVWTTGHLDSANWNVTGTNAAPISCANVAIDLSIDGGYTYPYNLVASTPNTGHCTFMVPNITSTTARIRVRAVGNIFFAISKANFTIKANPLPVVLSVFNGFATGTANQLYWTSVTETGTAYYELERSSNGANFTSIAKINAAVNSTTTKDYTYLDDSLGLQDWYYRLKMVDLNGTFNYSNIIYITRNGDKATIKVYPNPASDKIIITHDKTKNAQLNIYNAQGQLVHYQKLNPNEVATQIGINNFANGFYNVMIVDDNMTYKTKFIKNK